ncbi:hypothetical protein [Neisseria yangbaofengii]|uniref:hypothetical protein n=1 Tax=Neisseria yangbaofengii TaxID=2709396 RepID=UPI0013EA70F2|nr:hypothetical protein [Neisseria yangbaofengii]
MRVILMPLFVCHVKSAVRCWRIPGMAVSHPSVNALLIRAAIVLVENAEAGLRLDDRPSES